MRETIDTLYIYNLVDANGAKLQLHLGRIKGSEDFPGCVHVDKGYRWRFIGTKIPMPVRNGTWFNGFPVDTMLEWLNGNGWYLHTRVTMHNGQVHIFELPKGNANNPISDANEFPIHPEIDRLPFECVIRTLVRDCNMVTAVRVYRYAHGGTLYDAHQKVKEICNK